MTHSTFVTSVVVNTLSSLTDSNKANISCEAQVLTGTHCAVRRSWRAGSAQEDAAGLFPSPENGRPPPSPYRLTRFAIRVEARGGEPWGLRLVPKAELLPPLLLRQERYPREQ